jgi:hypothetical protein
MGGWLDIAGLGDPNAVSVTSARNIPSSKATVTGNAVAARAKVANAGS